MTQSEVSEGAFSAVLAAGFWAAAAACAFAARHLHHSRLHTLRAYGWIALAASMLSAAAAAVWTVRALFAPKRG